MNDWKRLPWHDFDEDTDNCRYCQVPRYAVEEGIVIFQCEKRPEVMEKWGEVSSARRTDANEVGD